MTEFKTIPRWEPYVVHRMKTLLEQGTISVESNIFFWQNIYDILPEDMPTPNVLPGDEDDSVMLIWHKNAIYLSIEFEKECPDEIFWWSRTFEGETSSGYVFEDKQKLNDIVNKIRANK